MSQRVLASKDAEQSLLGCVFYDETIMKNIADKIATKDFYYARHQIIFDAMTQMFRKGDPIDLTTLSAYLDAQKSLDECGGLQYLVELSSCVPSVSNIDSYLDIVKNKSIERSVVKVCGDIIADTDKDISDSVDFLESVEKRIFDVTKERRARDLVHISPILDDTIAKIEKNATSTDGNVTGLDTGYPDLNKCTMGLQNSELIILAARPSMGKTAFALNMATRIAMKETKPYVLFFSLEMGLEQLALRLLSTIANVPQNELKTGHFYSLPDKEAWNRINWAVKKLKECNLYFDESGMVKVQDLRNICRKAKTEGHLDLVVIDYLQLLSSRTRNESRTNEVSEISRTLKEMAKELNVPVIALSQLSRAVESREDKHPQMSDLRESGGIEQDADVIMFLYRDEYYKKEESTKKNIAEIQIAKNRNGTLGNVELLFKPEYTSFDSIKKDV